MTYKEEVELIRLYSTALSSTWKFDPNRETERRWKGFLNFDRRRQLEWIKWVEANTEKIDWCQRLVVMTITNTLSSETK